MTGNRSISDRQSPQAQGRLRPITRPPTTPPTHMLAPPPVTRSSQACFRQTASVVAISALAWVSQPRGETASALGTTFPQKRSKPAPVLGFQAFQVPRMEAPGGVWGDFVA